MKNVPLLSLLIAFASVNAHGASIAWSLGNLDGTGGVGDLSVSSTGTLIEAANFGGNGVPSPTINTVTFTGVDFPGGGSLTNLSDLTYNNSQSGIGASGIGSIDTLLDTIGFQSQVNSHSANLTGLISGRQYEVQFFISHLNTASRTLEISDGAGSAVVLQNANPSQFATGTFTANATTQAIVFDNLSTGSQLLNGYQLRDITIPEPSSALLACSGLLALIRRKRAH